MVLHDEYWGVEKDNLEQVGSFGNFVEKNKEIKFKTEFWVGDKPLWQ